MSLFDNKLFEKHQNYAEIRIFNLYVGFDLNAPNIRTSKNFAATSRINSLVYVSNKRGCL